MEKDMKEEFLPADIPFRGTDGREPSAERE